MHRCNEPTGRRVRSEHALGPPPLDQLNHSAFERGVERSNALGRKLLLGSCKQGARLVEQLPADSYKAGECLGHDTVKIQRTEHLVSTSKNASERGVDQFGS